AGALHSPRLLSRYLTSTRLDKALPAATHVGRHLKLHLLTALVALSPRVKGDLIRKTTLLTHNRFPHSSVQPLGFDGALIARLVRRPPRGCCPATSPLRAPTRHCPRRPTSAAT